MITVEVRRNLRHRPAEVWRVIGRFDAFDWASGVGPLLIDAVQPRHQIGAVRAFRHHGRPTRQRLTVFCAEDRSYSYETLEPHHGLPRYAATIAVFDGKGGNSTVIWTADFGTLVLPTARSFGGPRATAFPHPFDHEAEPTVAFDQAPYSCDHWIACFREECGKSLDNVQAILEMALSS